VPATPPEGEPAPLNGALPEFALANLGARPFSFYVHVPYCTTRCGYCDFNTYTAEELGGGASRVTYADTVIEEIRLARRVLGGTDLPLATVFFGGGTPTLLPEGDLGRIVNALRDEFGLLPNAEITTEANPDSVDRQALDRLRADGFTRISLGMQSARPHVLQVLDRKHQPDRPREAVAEARAAGFDYVNLDLIYGTPGETDEDWRASLETAVATGVDHVSAYSLIVEEGTALARRISRGKLPMPDDDVLADRYLIAEEVLTRAGLEWYEVSNWALPGHECRHNIAYWHSDDWWGAGPGAHSHVQGVRWWNVRHPAAYTKRLLAAESPAHARECLDIETRHVEDIMLRLRLAAGYPLSDLPASAEGAARKSLDAGLVVPEKLVAGRLVLTLRGRLLTDAVVRMLLD
jgi:oxygen-independent coproporphyrinogen-3 oxidase